MGDKLLVSGGNPLRGSITISGAKNSALPILAATVLCSQPVTITNLPDLQDVTTFLKLLELVGMEVTRSPHAVTITPGSRTGSTVPAELASLMRASILLLGPLLAKCGTAELGLPGGCAIGDRPIDQHLKGLASLGAHFDTQSHKLNGRCAQFVGAEFTFSVNSVTGSESVIMAASVAKGESLLHNVALEPEVLDLVSFLNAMGAEIEWVADRSLRIKGVSSLGAKKAFNIIPDRIESGTFLVAGALGGGPLTLRQTNADHLSAVIDHLRKMNATIEQRGHDELTVSRTSPLVAQDFSTQPYPGIPTDMQAQLMVLNCVAHGPSSIQETIFENRFLHIEHLVRMGAHITVRNNCATLAGGDTFVGGAVVATDLRASAGLLLAGLVAEGTTTIEDIYHLDRGYEKIDQKLNQLGAGVRRAS